MKLYTNLIIVVLLFLLPQLSFAEDEVIWESEKIPYLHDVIIAPQGDILYNINGKTLQIRRISDGKKIDSIVIQDVPNYLYHMSISSDGRYMAMTGDNPYVIIYDLLERKELKRITTVAYEREEYDKNVVYNAEEWISSSISPDGTKITGVVIHKDYYKTNFVVIDIESERVLFEQRRITYDYFNPSPNSFKWMSAEYSPDGNYIVAQLDFHIDGNNDASDSVYIYNAKTLKLHDVVLNSYSKYYTDIAFSKFENIFGVSSGSKLLLYNLNNKNTEIKNFENRPSSLNFSRKDYKLALRVGVTKAIIYDYKLDEFQNKISYSGLPQLTTIDNNLLYISRNSNLALINPNWNKITNVNNKDINPNIISPNPTTGILNISINNIFPSVFNYSLISDSGQVILSKELGLFQANANNLSIDISSIASGHYILRVFSDREEFTFNIIKEG